MPDVENPRHAADEGAEGTLRKRKCVLRPPDVEPTVPDVNRHYAGKKTNPAGRDGFIGIFGDQTDFFNGLDISLVRTR